MPPSWWCIKAGYSVTVRYVGAGHRQRVQATCHQALHMAQLHTFSQANTSGELLDHRYLQTCACCSSCHRCEDQQPCGVFVVPTKVPAKSAQQHRLFSKQQVLHDQRDVALPWYSPSIVDDDCITPKPQHTYNFIARSASLDVSPMCMSF